MILNLKYFGMIAEATSKENEVVNFDKSTTNDLIDELVKEYPNIKNLNYKIAVNQSIVADNYELKENDEIAILPPFAGG